MRILYSYFRVLHLRDNKIENLIPTELFNGFQNTLLRLDLSGDNNAVVNLQDLRRYVKKKKKLK